MKSPAFSPKEFLKQRRPERFSDTTASDIPAIDRAMLEYHLDTLTHRSQERIFEQFARGLIERTVCPNLLPQTGPTGGGDSKVDSETFPVAEQLAFVGPRAMPPQYRLPPPENHAAAPYLLGRLESYAAGMFSGPVQRLQILQIDL